MAKRRGDGEGCIYKRNDGRWVGQYLVYAAKGPKYRYLYGKTRREVDEKLTKATPLGPTCLSRFAGYLLRSSDVNLLARTTVKSLSNGQPASCSKSVTREKPPQIGAFKSALGRTRTCDLLIRSQVT